MHYMPPFMVGYVFMSHIPLIFESSHCILNTDSSRYGTFFAFALNCLHVHLCDLVLFFFGSRPPPEQFTHALTTWLHMLYRCCHVFSGQTSFQLEAACSETYLRYCTFSYYRFCHTRLLHAPLECMTSCEWERVVCAWFVRQLFFNHDTVQM